MDLEKSNDFTQGQYLWKGCSCVQIPGRFCWSLAMQATESPVVCHLIGIHAKVKVWRKKDLS